MNSVDLYKLKNDTKCVFLSENIISSVLDIFSKSNIKVIKCAKKQVSTIKTNKVQAKKDLNENKIIMIMNKISDNNINELIGEYLSNVLVDTEEKYNIIMTEIFNKMLKDIKFIENYIKFAIKIFIIEKKRLNLFPEEFIDLIKLTLHTNVNEEERTACYILVKSLIKYSFFNQNMINYISNIVLSTNIKSRYIDVYNWFNGLDINEYKESILNIANKCNSENMNREQILIESLIDNNKIITSSQKEISVEENDIINTSIVNIIEEYNFLKSLDEVIEFINTECNNINNKNLFCKEVIDFYIAKDMKEGLELVDKLINKKVLFKSNISKGLVMYLNDNNDNDNNSYKIIQILKYLKHNNITKNIEHIFKKYKVKLFYEN